MSLATDSPVPSSSSDDFAAFLDTELDSTSDTSPEPQDDDDDDDDNDDDNYDSDVERYMLVTLIVWSKYELTSIQDPLFVKVRKVSFGYTYHALNTVWQFKGLMHTPIVD